MAELGLSRTRLATGAIILSLAILAAPAQADGREKGEFWTFDVTLSTDIMSMRADVSGEVTFTVGGEDEITVGGTVYSTNVISVDGSLNGSVYLLDRVVGDVDLSLSGTQNEVASSHGILEENMMTIGDVVFEAGLFSFNYHLQEQVIIVADPPVLAEFDPVGSSVGDSWTRTVELETTSKTWKDGLVTNKTITKTNITYSLAVIASESVETPSGTHSTLKIRVSDDAGNYDFYWWSTGVNHFVRHELFQSGVEQPTMTMVLTDYGATGSSNWTAYIVVGAVVFVAAAVVLALVVLRKPPGQA